MLNYKDSETLNSLDLQKRLEEIRNKCWDGNVLSVDEKQEMEDIIDLKRELNYDDKWYEGFELIADWQFLDYCKELMHETCTIDPCLERFINYDDYADEQKLNYMECDILGSTFLYLNY